MTVARLVEYTHGRRVALPPHTTLEVVEHPAVIQVPGAAYYGWGLLAWQGQWLPMIDLDAVLRAYPGEQHARAPRYALIVAYQRGDGHEVEHGAIGLASLPVTVQVEDSAACDLPEGSDLWPSIALSCFEFEGDTVPIVDTAKLFGAYHC
jgi:hypothetical protein